MINHSVPVQRPPLPSASPVLVSGASFAGLATAFWLNRLGYQVTIVELASGLRRGGTPVDIEGETIGILERMGLFGAVRAKALPPRAFKFKDADDRTLGGIDVVTGAEEPSRTRFEIHRDDLLDILFSGINGSVEVLSNNSRTGQTESRSLSTTACGALLLWYLDATAIAPTPGSWCSATRRASPTSWEAMSI